MCGGEEIDLESTSENYLAAKILIKKTNAFKQKFEIAKLKRIPCVYCWGLKPGHKFAG